MRAAGPAWPSAFVGRVRRKRRRSSRGNARQRERQRPRALDVAQRRAQQLERLVEAALAQPARVQRHGRDDVGVPEAVAHSASMSAVTSSGPSRRAM